MNMLYDRKLWLVIYDRLAFIRLATDRNRAIEGIGKLNDYFCSFRFFSFRTGVLVLNTSFDFIRKKH